MNNRDDHDFSKIKVPCIFTVSDGTGETALSIVRAVKVQFESDDIKIERFNRVRTRENLEEILISAKKNAAIVVATLVDPNLRVYLLSRSMQFGIKVVDLLFPLLETISEQLGKRPSAIPGLLRQLDQDYFRRISAIEFTVRHDDGHISNDFAQADIVLVGVSRTSKTPLSMYLAHKGFKVSNIPLVSGVEPHKKLFEIDQNKIIALIIDPDRLAEIRHARIKVLGTKESLGAYSDVQSIFEEIEWSRALFKRNKKWPVLDVTCKALEENAVEIENIILGRFPHLKNELVF